MRVLHVFKDYYPPIRGGVEQHIHELTHSIGGFEFAVLCSSRSRKQAVENDGGVRVIRTPEYLRPARTPITPSWPRLLRRSGADLLHFHMPNPFGELAFLAARTRIPMVATYHADITGRKPFLPVFAPFQEAFLRRATRIVVTSPRMADSSLRLAAHSDRIAVVPFGVDAAYWGPRPAASDEIRSRYPGPLVIFLGRLVPYKGLEVLISAMRTIDATLLIAGDGPSRASLESAASRMRVNRKVVFLGEVSDSARAALYHAGELFALPSISRAEAFGIAMLEAMACGKPAVSTELGTGTSWVNISGETGLVVPPGDAAALAGAIKTLLADDDRRRGLGEAAAVRVANHFSRAAMLKSFGSLYESVITGGA